MSAQEKESTAEHFDSVAAPLDSQETRCSSPLRAESPLMLVDEEEVEGADQDSDVEANEVHQPPSVDCQPALISTVVQTVNTQQQLEQQPDVQHDEIDAMQVSSGAVAGGSTTGAKDQPGDSEPHNTAADGKPELEVCAKPVDNRDMMCIISVFR